MDLGGDPEGRVELDHHAGLSGVHDARAADAPAGPAAGLLLVLEGPEGVGKTTQVAALVERLRRRTAVAVRAYREPGGSTVGEAVRALLLDPQHGDLTPAAEALLFMAARAQLMARVRADLADGALVVLDRFFLSTYAYQVVGRGLPEAAVRSANQLAVGGVRPSLTLLLGCDPGVAQARVQARGGLDRMEREGAAFHGRVRDAFVAASAPAWQAAHPEVGPVAAVDAAGTVAEVARRIDRALTARWPETFRGLSESQ